METYFLDNGSINGGKQCYIQIFQISLVQSLLAILISVHFIAATNLMLRN
jgi:hypothetical protein